MYTVHEVSRLTGVSIRALHHYDAIGLLKPAQVTAAGYRLYDPAAPERLRSILLYRELQFSLKEIKTMLDSPAFDAGEALRQQIVLPEAQRNRTQKLIDHARAILAGGNKTMDFNAFTTTEMEQNRREAKERWGHTAAWEEYARREKAASPDRQQEAGARLMALLAETGALRPLSPEDAEVQAKVAALQQHVTRHFYTCTDEILAGLGQMYAADERFAKNIDAAGGEGCAAFAAQAIASYCSSLRGKRDSLRQ